MWPRARKTDKNKNEMKKIEQKHETKPPMLQY